MVVGELTNSYCIVATVTATATVINSNSDSN